MHLIRPPKFKIALYYYRGRPQETHGEQEAAHLAKEINYTIKHIWLS